MKTVKTDTLAYFKTALQARVWVTNSSMERGLNFKKKNTVYFNTWHGTPMKKMGTDMVNDNTAFKGKSTTHFDVMLSQGKFETKVFSKVYEIGKKHFLECGYPRNDELCRSDSAEVLKCKRKLGIKEDKKVILYCPTFREYERDDSNSIVMIPPITLEKWRKKLGDEYVLLFRAHYEVAKAMKIENNDFVKDMTDYPALNDLLIAADILISDYSSVLFDYSITGKTMFHFCYDYQKYVKNRGVYFDIREYISGAENEDELIELIRTYDSQVERTKSIKFRDKFVNFYGNATESSLKCIADKMGL